MDIVALLGLLQSWGPSAISAVLVVVVLYLIKQVNRSGEDNTKRFESVQSQIDSRLKDLRENTSAVLDEHSRRISNIELEYVRRETFYRELGGWKDDIKQLSADTSAQFMEIRKNIFDFLNRKVGR